MSIGVYMKKLFWFIGLFTAAALMQGCPGNSSGDNNTTACSAGSYYNNGYCYNPNNPNGFPAGYSYSVSFYAGQSGNSWGNGNTLQIVNAQKMKEFLKYAMGVCDRAANNYGQSSCDSYLSGDFSVTLQLPGSVGQQALVNFYTQPRINPYYNYYGQLPSGKGWANMAIGMLTGVWMPDQQYYTGAYKNPLQLSLTVSAINNSQGFELRGYGDNWTAANVRLVSIVVPQGKKEDPYFNFYLKFQGVTIAQGVMQKLLY